MKNYFIRLFDYDAYANELILNMIVKADESAQPVQLMAHLLTAQKAWYNRCKYLPPFNGALWPDWKADIFEQLINETHTLWIAFLNDTSDADFQKQVSYQNTKGDHFTNKLEDILAHVINHGTHHRAQAGQLMKLSGESLPNTDYIFYLRTLNL